MSDRVRNALLLLGLLCIPVAIILGLSIQVDAPAVADPNRDPSWTEAAPDLVANNSHCGTIWIADKPKTMYDYDTDLTDTPGLHGQAAKLENAIVQASDQNNTCIVARDKAASLPRGVFAAGVALIFLAYLRSPRSRQQRSPLRS